MIDPMVREEEKSQYFYSVHCFANCMCPSLFLLSTKSLEYYTNTGGFPYRTFL